MIEFCGILSDECKICTAKRIAKSEGILFLIVSIIISAIVIAVGIIKGTWIYSLIITAIFIVVTVIAFIPSKRLLRLKISTQLMIDNDTVSRSVVGGNGALATKPIKKVKKILDYGDWYYIIFRFGDMSNSWVCQKNLIVKGTNEEFEKIFEGKIKRIDYRK